jgi:spoIIIJ-associated protein
MTDTPQSAPRFDHDAVVVGLNDFLKLVLAQARLDLRYEVRALEPGRDDVEHPEVLVAFSGRDQDLLLERNAELLQALEYLAVRWLKLDPKTYDHVRFDSGDYRALRLEELKLSARVAAERVVTSRQPFRFNPMSSRERRIIHVALKDTPGVRTTSEGTGSRRQVVVYPAETK